MSVNKKTFISKCNTIVKNSTINLGVNPIMELNYGKTVTRGLIYFDHSEIKKMVEDGTYPDMSKLKHVLHMTNTSSITNRNINDLVLNNYKVSHKKRAVSFDVILFLLPKEWDMGRGFDYVKDVYNEGGRGFSTDGSNWHNYKNYCAWDTPGVYSLQKLSLELDAFTSPEGNKSELIVGTEHFDYGNEPLEIDITDTVNKFITGELCNYGLGIAFSPKFEQTETKFDNFIGFFTQHTNSFYEPYVETTYDDYIKDDRLNFCLDKKNRLYFYATVGDKSVCFDEMPKAEIDGVEYEASMTTKGCYYIDVELSSDEYEEDTMCYDTWKNLKYKGKDCGNVELSFVIKPSNHYFKFGLPSEEKSDERFQVNLYGISYFEKILRGDLRKVSVECVIPYTSNQQYPANDIYYRLYTKDGDAEVDVISYSHVEMGYNNNYFLIDTNDLIPSRYYVDIKVVYDKEVIVSNEILEFDVVKDKTGIF